MTQFLKSKNIPIENKIETPTNVINNEINSKTAVLQRCQIANANELIQNSANKFCISLHKKNKISRKDVLSIRHLVVFEITNCIGEILVGVLSNKLDCNQLKLLNQLVKICSNPFEEIETEHKFFQKLKDLTLLCMIFYI